jgi:hypothetical protein
MSLLLNIIIKTATARTTIMTTSHLKMGGGPTFKNHVYKKNTLNNKQYPL